MCDPILCTVFVTARRIPPDVSTVSVQNAAILSCLMEFEFSILEKYKISNFMTIGQVELQLFHVGGRTGTTRLKVAFHNFSTASGQHRSRSAEPPTLPSALLLSACQSPTCHVACNRVLLVLSPIFLIVISPLKLTHFPKIVQSIFVSLTNSALGTPLAPHNCHTSRSPQPP